MAKRKSKLVKVTTTEQMVAPASAPPRRRRRRQRKSDAGGYTASQALNPPAARGVIAGRPNPRITTPANGINRVCNTEMIVAVNTSDVFASAIIRLNPSSLPWLNGVASNYSKFRWRRIDFVYVPSCSTTTPGTFSMALQYDEPDANPSTLIQMSSQYGFVSAPYWGGGGGAFLLNRREVNSTPESVVCRVDVNKFTEPWYRYITASALATLSGAGATGPATSNIYIPAILVYSTVGGAATPVGAGQIYVRYDIDLIEPISSALNS